MEFNKKHKFSDFSRPDLSARTRVSDSSTSAPFASRVYDGRGGNFNRVNFRKMEQRDQMEEPVESRESDYKGYVRREKSSSKQFDSGCGGLALRQQRGNERSIVKILNGKEKYSCIMSTPPREKQLREIRSLLHKQEAEKALDPASKSGIISSGGFSCANVLGGVDTGVEKLGGSPFEPIYSELQPRRTNSDNAIGNKPFSSLSQYISGKFQNQGTSSTDQIIMNLLNIGNQLQMTQNQTAESLPAAAAAAGAGFPSALRRPNTPPPESPLSKFQSFLAEHASQPHEESKASGDLTHRAGKNGGGENDLLGNVISDQQAMAIYKRLNAAGANTGDRRVKRNWHHSETQLLFWVIKTYSKEQKIDSKDLSLIDWEKVSQFVPGRNANQCQYKWQSNHKPKNTKAPWTAEEDTALKRIIEEKGAKSWADISRLLNLEKVGPPRQGKQCRERWFNHVNPAIKWDSWTEWEDITLLKKQQAMGNKWSEIAKCIPGRTENSVKNRFNSLAKKERTKIQEQNKVSNNPRAESAVDLKQSMTTFFKGKSSTSNNDIWIEPLIKQLMEQFCSKHSEQYDIDQPPESEMQWNQLDDFKQDEQGSFVSELSHQTRSKRNTKREPRSANNVKIEITPPPAMDSNLLMPPANPYAGKQQRRLGAGSVNNLIPPSAGDIRSSCNSVDGKTYTLAGDVLIRSAPGSRQLSPLATLEEMQGDQEEVDFRKHSESIHDDDFKIMMTMDQKEYDQHCKKILSEVGEEVKESKDQKYHQHLYLHHQQQQHLAPYQSESTPDMKEVLQRMNLQNSPYFNEENGEGFPHTNSGLLGGEPHIPLADMYLFENPSKVVKQACTGKIIVDEKLRASVMEAGVKFTHSNNLNFTVYLTEEGVYLQDGEKMFQLADLHTAGGELSHTLSFGRDMPKILMGQKPKFEEDSRMKDLSPLSGIDSVAGVFRNRQSRLGARKSSTFQDQPRLSLQNPESVIDASDAGGYLPSKRSNSNNFLQIGGGFTPSQSDIQFNEPITPPPSFSQMVKQINKKGSDKEIISSTRNSFMAERASGLTQVPEEKSQDMLKPLQDSISALGNLGISAQDFLATLGGQSLQDYTNAQMRNEVRRMEARGPNPSNCTAPSISEDNGSQASSNFISMMNRDQIRYGGLGLPNLIGGPDGGGAGHGSLNSSSLAQLNRTPPSYPESSTNPDQPLLNQNRQDSSAPPSYKLGGLGSIFAVPGQSQAEKIAQVIKKPGPPSYNSNPDVNNEIPNTPGPGSVGGISLQFLAQPNFQKPGPLSIGYPNNNRALSQISGPFQPFPSGGNYSSNRPHYDYDCNSVISKDHNE